MFHVYNGDRDKFIKFNDNSPPPRQKKKKKKKELLTFFLNLDPPLSEDEDNRVMNAIVQC